MLPIVEDLQGLSKSEVEKRVLEAIKHDDLWKNIPEKSKMEAVNAYLTLLGLK